MNFEAVIGLEIHVEMKTKSKMFSSAPVTFGEKPNTNVAPLDIAFPGSMPTVNKQAVINAIRMCSALHMSIDDELWFNRKNYFYSDLSKGYQITQQRRPIGKDGYISLGGTRFGVERLHIEEDTCKQIHKGDFTYLDYNRSGIPLLEIVSKPDIRSGEEAMRYVEEIRNIAYFLDVSDGRMSEGSLRCDVNISLRPIGSQRLGRKVEIKNLNTLANIKTAIDFEINRQQSILLSGGSIKQETRRFDESIQETVSLRTKVDTIDYKFFVEPNIAPIKLSKEFVEDAINSSNELPEQKRNRYNKLGLSDYDIYQLLKSKDICHYFDELVNNGASPKSAANWVIVDIQGVLNKKNLNIKEFPIEPYRLAELIQLIDDSVVFNKQAKVIFDRMLMDKDRPKSIVAQMGVSLIGDESELKAIVEEVLNENTKSISDYKNGKDRVVGYLVAQVMKKTNGKADPKITNKLITQMIKER